MLAKHVHASFENGLHRSRLWLLRRYVEYTDYAKMELVDICSHGFTFFASSVISLAKA